jgi:hypothetical protein
MAWSALVEEEVEKGDSLHVAAALSTLAMWISSAVAEEWLASLDWDIFWVERLKGVARESEGKKIGKMEWELMGFGMRNDVQLYMCDMCHGVVIHFPRQRFISVITTHMIWPQDWEAEKVGGLKYCETHNIQEKESRSMGQWSLVFINPIGAVIRLNKKVRYYSRRTSLDWHMDRIVW